MGLFRRTSRFDDLENLLDEKDWLAPDVEDNRFTDKDDSTLQVEFSDKPIPDLQVKDIIKKDPTSLNYYLDKNQIEKFLDGHQSQIRDCRLTRVERIFLQHLQKQTDIINYSLNEMTPEDRDLKERLSGMVDKTLDSNLFKHMEDVDRYMDYFFKNSDENTKQEFENYLKNREDLTLARKFPTYYTNYTRTTSVLGSLQKSLETVNKDKRDDFLNLFEHYFDGINKADPDMSMADSLLNTFTKFSGKHPESERRFIQLNKRMIKNMDTRLWKRFVKFEQKIVDKYPRLKDSIKICYSISNLLSLTSADYYLNTDFSPKNKDAFLPKDDEGLEFMARLLPSVGETGSIVRYSKLMKSIAKSNKHVALDFMGSTLEYLEKNNLEDVIGEIEFKGKYMKSKTFSVIPFDDSDLWYAFAESIMNAETSETYVENYDTEMKLIDANIDEILRDCGPSIKYVDLGPGDGYKTSRVIDKILARDANNSVKSNLFMVDILEDILKHAHRNIERDLQKRVDIESIVSDFHTLKINDRFKRMSQDPYRLNLFSLLGTTFCNFEPEEITGIFHEIMGTNDKMLLGVQLYPDDEADIDFRSMMESYKSDEIRDLSYDPMKVVGFPEEFDPHQLKYVVDFTARSNSYPCIRTHFEVIAPHGIRTDVRHYNNGDIIPILKSYKYRKDDMEEIISDNNFSIDHADFEENIGLYVIKRTGNKKRPEKQQPVSHNTRPLFS